MSLRIIFLLICLMGFLPPLFAAQNMQVHSSETVQADEGSSRIGRGLRVLTRGIMNLVTLPVEIPRTILEERRKRPKGWMLIVLPRTIENVMARGVSAVHDSLVYPLYVSDNNDNKPWSRGFDLPDYPWQFRYQTDLKGAAEDDTSQAQFFGIRG